MVKRYVRRGCGCRGQTGWPLERTPAKCEQVHDVTNAAVIRNADEAKSEVRVAVRERERVEVSERERGAAKEVGQLKHTAPTAALRLRGQRQRQQRQVSNAAGRQQQQAAAATAAAAAQRHQ